MPDDLRTRIAAVLFSLNAGEDWNMEPLVWEEISDSYRECWFKQADAVIRELKLTQQYLVDGIISDGEPHPWEVPCETRYATEWERFNE